MTGICELVYVEDNSFSAANVAVAVSEEKCSGWLCMLALSLPRLYLSCDRVRLVSGWGLTVTTIGRI